jgi:hypothetical protein
MKSSSNAENVRTTKYGSGRQVITKADSKRLIEKYGKNNMIEVDGKEAPLRTRKDGRIYLQKSQIKGKPAGKLAISLRPYDVGDIIKTRHKWNIARYQGSIYREYFDEHISIVNRKKLSNKIYSYIHSKEDTYGYAYFTLVFMTEGNISVPVSYPTGKMDILAFTHDFIENFIEEIFDGLEIKEKDYGYAVLFYFKMLEIVTQNMLKG